MSAATLPSIAFRVFLPLLLGAAVVAPAQARLRVFACEPEWGSLVHELAGDKVDVDVATSALQDVHVIEAKLRGFQRRRYRLVAPWRERPEVGDLLCYSREARVADYRGLVAFFDQGGGSLKTHCDIVVGVDLDGDSKLYTIGGNLMQTVMMRKLPLNASGRFVPPAATAADAPCRMNEERACSLNAKAWVALLKLRD